MTTERPLMLTALCVRVSTSKNRAATARALAMDLYINIHTVHALAVQPVILGLWRSYRT